jgi:hypothetical protein
MERKLYYLSLDRSMMVVSVRSGTGFEFDAPKVLFKVPEASPCRPGHRSADDNERKCGAISNGRSANPSPPPALPQITSSIVKVSP